MLFVLLAAWCFGSRRVDHSLAALGLYLGLLGGYLKLRTGNQYATLGRDLLVVAIAAGAAFRAMRSRLSGVLYPVGEESALAHAMRELARDSERRARLVDGGRDAVAAYHPDVIAARVLTVYLDLVEPIGGGR